MAVIMVCDLDELSCLYTDILYSSKVPENPPPSLSPADRLKEQGNTLFKSGDHLGAVELYTRALRKLLLYLSAALLMLSSR
jgi:hypothetical protein